MMGQVATTPEQALALQEAVERGDYEGVVDLLAAGISTNYPPGETSALLEAVEKGFWEIADLLIKHRADVNHARASDGQTSLLAATVAGSVDLCTKLIKAGASVNAWNKRAMTPLFTAISHGHVSLVEQFLQAGACPNGNYKPGVPSRIPGLYLPLHEAVSGRQNDIAILLCKHKVKVNTQDIHGRTPLHLAARTGNTRLVQVMIDHQATVDATDENKATPLHMACREGRLDVAKTLVDNGCSVTSTRKGWGCDAFTPLHDAAQNNHGDIVKLLCWAQANVNAEDSYNKTPLHIACERGYHDIVTTLIAYGCDTNITDIGGFPPIFSAVKCKRVDIVKILLRAMCRVDITDGAGRTVLHHAAEKGMHEIVHELAEHGANINKPDKFRCTPLRYSICSGNIQCVFNLLQHGHDLPRSKCKVSELLQMVILPQRADIYKMLVTMGWRPRVEGFPSMLDFIKQTAPLSELILWVESDDVAPPCLLNLCRCVIRHSLLTHTNNTSTFKLIDKLKLPSDMLEFIQLKDVQDKFMIG